MLWFCIRTIVYALFLLSTIRDIDTGINVPALSTYLLITFTVIDIFLFIYFLHYITRSVKCDTIIGRIFMETKHSLEKKCNREKAVGKSYLAEEGLKIKVTISGIYVGFQKEKLLRLCEKENFVISFIYPAGTFVLKGAPFLVILDHGKPESIFLGDYQGFPARHTGDKRIADSKSKNKVRRKWI